MYLLVFGRLDLDGRTVIMAQESGDIFGKITLPWRGEVLELEPTMRLAHAIELAINPERKRTFFDAVNNPGLTDLAAVYAIGIRHAGVKVDDWEVFCEVRKIMQGDSAGMDAALSLIDQVMTGLMPDQDTVARSGKTADRDAAKN